MATTQGIGIIFGNSTTAVGGYTAVSGDVTVTSEDVSFEADSVELKDRNGEVQSVYNLSQETWPQSSPYKARERRTGCAEGVIGATSVVEISPLVGLRGRDHG